MKAVTYDSAESLRHYRDILLLLLLSARCSLRCAAQPAYNWFLDKPGTGERIDIVFHPAQRMENAQRRQKPEAPPPSDTLSLRERPYYSVPPIPSSF
ncbi:hypothetical protein AXG93_815s1160 [Marchantia polymorpha subsp. ruderalis]|uniref:Uncharacterized protein n=1 Tax=Marchantia polymorpha subsp. ruderalis TaxID=1480154 RepID=A0A176W1U1_MARPO|nr:hypothetical protein AXG93_815s1160 [Marchantia polymorpha subsp. ruderalis]